MFAQPTVSVSPSHHIERHSQPAPSRQHALRIFDLTVELLIARAIIGEFWVAGFNDAAALLPSLPLPTSDFATANRHLQNAAAYCKQKEVGAATFELRSLRGYSQRL